MASRISHQMAKLGCAREWGGWGRLSDDGPGQHNPDRSEGPRVQRETACTEVAHKHIVPDTEQGTPMNAESTKDEGKPVHWEGLV